MRAGTTDSRQRARAQPAVSRPERERWVGLALTGPVWVLLVLGIGGPLLVALVTSLTDRSLISLEPSAWVGLDNYVDRVFTERFLSSLGVTVVIIVASVAVQLPLGLALAMVLAQPLAGRRFFRGVISLPMLLTPVAVGLMFRFVADPDLGALRWASALLDDGWQPNLLGSQVGALGLIVAVNSWINVPFVTLMTLAALVGVPRDMYEAAELDGAGAWRTFTHITLPSIAPVLAVTAALRVAADFRMFDLVFSITRGGPGRGTVNLSMLAYQESMVNFQLGRACAIALAMAVIVLPFFWFFNRMLKP